MEPNKTLSVVIPTYNRARLLDDCLSYHIPLFEKYGIEIYISDNNSSDATAEIVEKHRQRYPYIHYYKNDRNMGPDENFERALKYPKTDYIWLLGDSYRIPIEGIQYVIQKKSFENNQCDVFLFNINDEVKNIQSRDYRDRNLLLVEMGWIMTCMSCIVYSAEVIKKGAFARYRGTYFIQTGIIFEHIAQGSFLIHWEQSISVKRWNNANGINKVSWQDRIFEIWFKSRANFFLSLPASYDLESKLKAIMSNGPHPRVSIKSLLGLRANGILNWSQYKRYKYLFPFTVGSLKYVILIIALLPKFPLQLARKARKIYRSSNRAD